MSIRFLMTAALLVALAPHPAAAGRRYSVKVDSMPAGASIYLETRTAGVVGTTPHTFKLEQGRYTLILELSGYETLTRAVTVKRNGAFTYTLVRLPDPATFAIEPAAGSDAAGASVAINGKQVGKVPVKVSLRQGRYLVEVTKPGFQRWSQWIDVKQRERRTLMVSLVSAIPVTGNILVSANVSGAQVYLDGKLMDKVPALLDKVAAGKHSVELRAEGYAPARRDVNLRGGQTIKLVLELVLDSKTLAATTGTLQVVAEPAGVEILVDGKSQGDAPVKVEALTQGSHIVEGRKEGYTTAEQMVELKQGQLHTIKLVLEERKAVPRTGALRVVGEPHGALVFVDGQLVGKVPLLRKDLLPGPHVISVRHKGHDDLVQTVEIKSGQIAELQARLVSGTPGPMPTPPPSSQPSGQPSGRRTAPGERPGKDTRRSPHPWPSEMLGRSSHGAQLVEPRAYVTDAALGFPYIFQIRLTTGLFQWRWLGMDAALRFRTFGALNEVGLQTRLRVYYRFPFAVAALFDIGGGGGPAGRNTWSGNIGAMGSMVFKKRWTFAVKAYLNFYSDQLCPTEAVPGDEMEVCSKPQTEWPNGLEQSPRQRFDGLRLFLAAIAEVAVHRRVNLFGIFEGAPIGGGRWAYRDAFVPLMPKNDIQIYGRVGANFKF